MQLPISVHNWHVYAYTHPSQSLEEALMAGEHRPPTGILACHLPRQQEDTRQREQLLSPLSTLPSSCQTLR